MSPTGSYAAERGACRRRVGRFQPNTKRVLTLGNDQYDTRFEQRLRYLPIAEAFLRVRHLKKPTRIELIVGATIIAAIGLWIYFSPYQTCVRARATEAAARAVVADKGVPMRIRVAQRLVQVEAEQKARRVCR
jgi:hypothetical protein